MPLEQIAETITLLVIVCLMGVLVWHRPLVRMDKGGEEGKRREGGWRRWKAKTPKDCPACQAGFGLTVRPIQREAKPWHERKSKRGRKKTIPTQDYACLNPACDYHGITDAGAHALVGNGKRGLRGDSQTLKCQCAAAASVPAAIHHCIT